METVEAVVVGAGVVGLAIAKRLAEAGLEVVILDRADAIGTETSSRNSEVVHAGIYYPQGSLKGRFCVEGRRLLYPYCVERGVAHRRIGKLLVATDENQIAKLRKLQDHARANGLTHADEALEMIDAARAGQLEPQVSCVAALWSPSTGIVDSHGLMLAFLGDAENRGAMLALNTRVDAVRPVDHGFVLETVNDGERFEISTRHLVNSAGLHAQSLARSIEGFPAAHVPAQKLVKGNYFALAGVRAPFTHLVYPMPNDLGLGVHATIDLGGQVRFGPDTEVIDRIEYSVDAGRGDSFYDSIRAYWPGLPGGALRPDYCGIRPKLDRPEPDFVIDGPSVHGVPGLVNLFGIESPGLTASLAIAGDVFARLALPAHSLAPV